jgi:hypothetical protein
VLQKGKAFDINDLLQKVDRCISYLIPYVNAFNSKSEAGSSSSRMTQSLHSKPSEIRENSVDRLSVDDNFRKHRNSADEEINKVNKSFIFQSPDPIPENLIKEEVESRVLLDYFVLRYNLAYNDYEVRGRQGPHTDRKVFVDLLTFDSKKAHT